MGRGRSGRVSASSASRTVTHPTVTDIDTYGWDLYDSERRQWYSDTLNVDDLRAQIYNDTVYGFTGNDFRAIHRNENETGNNIIDDIIDNPNSPVYADTQFRGLKFFGESGLTPRQEVEAILASGIWKEPGATSFSASRHVANDFASWDSTSSSSVSVVVVYSNPTTGMPIKHLSRFAFEDEVLHSRKQMTNGYAITGSQWSADGRRVEIYIKDR